MASQVEVDPQETREWLEALDADKVGFGLPVLVDPEARHGGIISHSVQRN